MSTRGLLMALALAACAPQPRVMPPPPAETDASTTSPSATTTTPAASMSAPPPTTSPSAMPVPSSSPPPQPAPPLDPALARVCKTTSVEPCFGESTCTTLATRLDANAFSRAATCLRAAKQGGKTCVPARASACVASALDKSAVDPNRGGECAALHRRCVGEASLARGFAATCLRSFAGLTEYGSSLALDCITCDDFEDFGAALGRCMLQPVSTASASP